MTIIYALFALGNPELDEDLDIADYLWRTASSVIGNERNDDGSIKKFPEAVALRKTLFNALDNLSHQGPTLEDAGVMQEELYVGYKEPEYITHDIRKRLRKICRFTPLTDSLFNDMVVHTVVKPLGKAARDYLIDEIKDETSSSAPWILRDMYEHATQEQRDLMKEAYMQWRSREVAKDQLIRDLYEVITPQDPEVNMIIQNCDLDFGNFKPQKGYITRAGPMVNAIARQNLDDLFRVREE